MSTFLSSLLSLHIDWLNVRCTYISFFEGMDIVFWISIRLEHLKRYLIRYRSRLTMISLSLTLEREFDDYVTIRRLNQWYL